MVDRRPSIPGMKTEFFDLRGAHITLDALLKATGVAESGGAAKGVIAAGGASVNGTAETRRGRKLRNADEVSIGMRCIRLRSG